MARTRVRWGRVAGLALAAVLTGGAAGGAAHAGGKATTGPGQERQEAVRTYVVRPGDTLWGLAVRLAGPLADPRPLMDGLAALNHTDGELQPGQVLRLPEG